MLLYQRLLAFLNLRKSVKLIFVIQRYAKRLRRPQAPFSDIRRLCFGICYHIFKLDMYRNIERKKFRYKFLISEN